MIKKAAGMAAFRTFDSKGFAYSDKKTYLCN